MAATSVDASQLQGMLSRYQSSNLANIIETLSGDKDNIRVDLQQVKFYIGKQHFEVNGKINFNVIHKDPNAHAKAKEVKENR